MILKLLSFLSRISFRLLCFNILLVFLPVAGILYLDTYEKQLLIAQENAMVQQGRLFSAAISSFLISNTNHQEIDKSYKSFSKELLLILNKRTLARIRIIDNEGTLIADSSTYKREQDNPDYNSNYMAAILNFYHTNEYKTGKEYAEENWLYKLASWPVRFFRKYILDPPRVAKPITFYKNKEKLLGPEIQAALRGEYGSITRLSAGEQRSVTMYSAIPIKNKDKIIGAVLISQSTYRILNDLYEVRLWVFRIFLASILAALIISFVLSFTIARPLHKLRAEAEEILDKRGRLTRHFKPLKRKDEIGALSRSLVVLTQQLKKHIEFIESFASDLSHEFKNPMAAIRSATEIAIETGNKKERNHFLEMVQKNISRMEKLLTGAREISKIDTRLIEDECENVELNTLLLHIIEGFKLRKKSLDFKTDIQEKPVIIFCSQDRLAQVIENLLDNAVSFSPDKTRITLKLSQLKQKINIEISDEGPGIPEEHIDKIFDRFFTFRPEEQKKTNNIVLHTGLGLSIVKAIVEGYSGNINVINLPDKGTKFIICLPVKCLPL